MTQHSIPSSRQDREIRNAVAKVGSGAFSVRETTGQTLAHSGWRVVNFDTAINNPDGWYSTTAYTFTPKVPGYYLFTVNLALTAARTTLLDLSLFVDGAEALRIGSTITTYTCHGSGILFLNGSNVVDLRAYPTTNNAVLAAQTYQNIFSGVLVSTKAA